MNSSNSLNPLSSRFTEMTFFGSPSLLMQDVHLLDNYMIVFQVKVLVHMCNIYFFVRERERCIYIYYVPGGRFFLLRQDIRLIAFFEPFLIKYAYTCLINDLLSRSEKKRFFFDEPALFFIFAALQMNKILISKFTRFHLLLFICTL